MHNYYTTGNIPSWCRMSVEEYMDPIIGCWGLADGAIKIWHDCEYCKYQKLMKIGQCYVAQYGSLPEVII